MASGRFKIILQIYAFTRSNWCDLGESAKHRDSLKSIGTSYSLDISFVQKFYAVFV